MTPAQAKDMYARQMADHGETVTITGSGTSNAVPGRRAKISKDDPLTDSVDQTAMVYVVLADTMTFTPEQGDRLSASDGAFTIAAVSARRIGTTLIAYDLAVAG